MSTCPGIEYGAQSPLFSLEVKLVALSCAICIFRFSVEASETTWMAGTKIGSGAGKRPGDVKSVYRLGQGNMASA